MQKYKKNGTFMVFSDFFQLLLHKISYNTPKNGKEKEDKQQ